MNEKPSSLQDAVLKVLAYFDLFDYPLTVNEIHKWLPSTEVYSLREARSAAIMLTERGIIEQRFGLFFFPNRAELVNVRTSRYAFAKKKFEKAIFTAKVISWIAGVEHISVCNNVGYSNGKADSDIDFFIVSAPNRLWWSRLLVTILVALLGVRRHGRRVANRVCLSFYVSSSHLNFDDIKLPKSDPYLLYWFATLFPIYGLKRYNELMASNADFLNEIPGFIKVEPSHQRSFEPGVFQNFYLRFVRRILNSWLGESANKAAKFIQLQKMKKNIHSLSKENNSKVIISDEMLKFHETDQRENYLRRLEAKLSELNHA